MPKLKDFQREDVNFIKENGLRVLLANAQGTGKTPTAIRAIAETYLTSLPALIVAPASITRNWGREIGIWAPGITSIVIDDSTTPLPKFKGPLIFIISWTLLDHRTPELLDYGIKTIVADECHYAKNPTSVRSMALARMTEKAKGILLLTGTPIINTQHELTILERLLGTENPPMLRRFLEDVAPEVPPKKRSYLYVEMSEKYQREYGTAETAFEDWLRAEKEKLLGEGLAEYEVERTLIAEALAKVGYLRRLAGVAKVEAAAIWIAKAVRIGEPVVVFCEHQPVLRKLEKLLKKQRIRYIVIEGKTPAKQRQKAVDAFQNHEYPVFLGTKAAKEGITLTAARHLLFVERFFTSAEEEQAEDRIRRIGQQHPTTIWFMQALGTIDDRIDTIVRGKRQIVRAAVGAADIEETETKNVASLIQQWGEFSKVEGVTTIGDRDALPPLPLAREVQAITFYGSRWKKHSALTWCKMNGYPIRRLESLAGRLKLSCHEEDMFIKGEYHVLSISKDIRVIVGKRVSKANARRARSQQLWDKKTWRG